MEDLLTQLPALWQAYGQYVMFAGLAFSAYKSLDFYKKNKPGYAQFWILVAILLSVM